MLVAPENMVVQLADRNSLAFRGARNVCLECVNGMVWLTIEGQQDDFVLIEGEQFCIESNDLAIVQGLPSGSIHLYRLDTESVFQGWVNITFIPLIRISLNRLMYFLGIFQTSFVRRFFEITLTRRLRARSASTEWSWQSLPDECVADLNQNAVMNARLPN